MTFAVVPAGGKSTRMGRPKLALPLGDRSVLEHVVAALRAAGLQQVLVVVAAHLAELAGRAGASVCVLEEETADMRATVEHGLRWLEEKFNPRPQDHWLLAPADHPTLAAEVVVELLAARAAHPEASVVVPTFAGRRGHPTLIDWKHAEGMRCLPKGQGLNVYLRQLTPRETLELPVATETILWDLDTPEDYERLRRAWRL
jgi:molybdenum cofactor cytidylyltransferase